MKRILSIIVSVLMFVQVSAQDKHQSVGLVLSGGGAKGIAHIGVIQALEENGIPIDYITGTSMGAIVGGLYAAGYSPEEMLQLIESPEFMHWSTGQIDEKLTYYFAKSRKLPTLVSFDLGRRDSTKANSLLPQGLISPLPMNFAFMELFASHTAQCGGDFDNLFVPFRCVASDVTHKHKVVCGSGQLGDAIRASMTFPIVFYPIEINGVTLYDGGIYDNFPVEPMKQIFAPSIIIGVNVSSSNTEPTSNNIIDQLSEMIIQGNTVPLSHDDGIYLELNLKQYNLLDFQKAKAIYDVGYKRTIDMIDTITSRIKTRISPQTVSFKRQVYKSRTPALRFDSVRVDGGTAGQNEYLKYIFTHKTNDTLDISDVREAYYQALTPGKLKNLTPHAFYRPSDELFTLQVDASVKDNFSVGVGGYATTSSNSMLFLSGRYNTLNYNSLDAGLNVWIGQSYMAAEALSRVSLRSAVPSYFELEAIVSRQKYYETDNFFYEDNTLSFITKYEYFTRLKYCVAAGRRAKFDISAGYGHLKDRFYQNDGVAAKLSGSLNEASYDLGQARLKYEYYSLDDESYPTSGARYVAAIAGIAGRYKIAPKDGSYIQSNDVEWGQIELNAEKYWNAGQHFAFGSEINVLASTRKLMSDYNASLVQAPSFSPTQSSCNVFNPSFRANSYVTAGVKPIWKLADNMQVRGEVHAFMPMREIMRNGMSTTPYYGKWFSKMYVTAETAFVLNFPFAALTAYANYKNSHSDQWNFGLSIGLFFLAPRFIH